jgi:hypothetical protein
VRVLVWSSLVWFVFVLLPYRKISLPHNHNTPRSSVLYRSPSGVPPPHWRGRFKPPLPKIFTPTSACTPLRISLKYLCATHDQTRPRQRLASPSRRSASHERFRRMFGRVAGGPRSPPPVGASTSGLFLHSSLACHYQIRRGGRGWVSCHSSLITRHSSLVTHHCFSNIPFRD